MSVLLIQPEYHINEEQRVGLSAILQPSIGLGYLESILRQHQIDVYTVDLNIESSETIKTVLQNHPIRIIGLTTYTYTYANFLRALRLCKTLAPQACIVAGGVHATYDYKTLLKENIDYIIRFEGEYPFLTLCQKLLTNQDDLGSIPNLVYKRDREIYRNRTAESLASLDELPFPALHMEKYRARMVPMITSRGCSFQCIYCSTGSYWGAAMRFRSVANIVAEIQQYTQAGYTNFCFMDDNINTHKARFVELCEALIPEKITWTANCSVMNLTDDLLLLMKQAGCKGLSIGIESADPEVQKKIGKIVDLDRAEGIIRRAMALNIQMTCGFILYHFCDTPETLKRTLDYAQKIQNYGAVSRYTINTPFKGTRQFDQRDELGIRIIDEHTEHYDLVHSVIDTSNFSHCDMVDVQRMNCLNINEENLTAYLKKMNITDMSAISPEVMQKIIRESNLFAPKQ